MIHIITRNNEKTIQATMESLLPTKQKVLVGDYDSSDSTKKICEAYGAEVVPVRGGRDEARNYLMELSPQEVCFYIEPWEVLAKGHEALKCNPAHYRVMVIQNGIITKETRVWLNNGPRFINPIYEELDVDTNASLPVTLYSSGMPTDNLLESIENWKRARPTASSPWYYQACALLCLQRYDEFLRVSEHYMHVGDKASMPAIMNRYYFAMVQVIHSRKVRPALQNLSICIANKPLMAEFWCLLGDVYYHLLQDIGKAKAFYENALILGKKRPLDDEWPVDISKYSKYPQKMIDYCRKGLEDTFVMARIPDG